MANRELRKRFADYIKWGKLADNTVNPNTLNAMEGFHNEAINEAVRDFATEVLDKFEVNATTEEFSYLDDCIQQTLAQLKANTNKKGQQQ